MAGYTRAEAKASLPVGWSKLVDKAYDTFDRYPDLIISDVKEKYASLRIDFFYPNYYYDPNDIRYETHIDMTDDLLLLINTLETESLHTCQKCGDPSKVRTKSGWLFTLCDKCDI